MTRFRGFTASIVILMFLFSTLSCKNRKSSEESDVDKSDIEISDSRDELFREITPYPIPTSFEVIKLLNEAGAPYQYYLCNEADNVDRYMNLRSKALNLGVYGADLSYAATYKQKQETGLYLNASAKLIDELQITSGFNEDLVKRVDANLENVDSLINIISESFYDTYEYLTMNEQDELAILVMAGSWIEALYLTTQIHDISKNKEQIRGIIADQNSSLEKLIEVMEPVKDNPMCSDIYADLGELHELYKGVTGDMSDVQLEEIVNSTRTLRTSIIS